MSSPKKYRIWDKSRKQMKYPNWELSDKDLIPPNEDSSTMEKAGYFLLNQNGIVFCNDCITLDDWHDGFEIMSFTGLKDKTGIEVYEGDIVNVTNKGIYNGTKVVVWDETLLCYVLVWASKYSEWKTSSSGITYLKVSSGISCNVVGNIYKDAKLLIQ